jgi:hypothetical protein
MAAAAQMRTLLEKQRIEIERLRSLMEAEEAKADVLQERLAIQEEQIVEQFDREEVDWLHRDGSPAAYRSFLRHLGVETDNILDRLWAAGGGDHGSRAFRNEARRIARQFDATLREVYTLFFST